MIIMGFDISSTNIGVVTWDTTGEGQALRHQTIRLNENHSLGRRLLAGHAELTMLFPTLRPDLVAYEGPAYSKKNVLSIFAQAAMAGQLLALCAGIGIPTVVIQPTTAKKALSGSGKADKEEMILCASAYLSGPYDEHAADALGVVLAAVQKAELEQQVGKPAPRPRRRKVAA